MLKLFCKTFLIGLLSCSLMIMDLNSKGLVITSAQAESVKTEGVKDDNLMATLTMTAVGLLTSRLWTCTKTADMIVAATGGAAFVAGEVISTLKLKSVMKDMETQITRDQNGNINNEQIRALERLKQSYEEAKKSAGTKKTLQQAAAAAFLAAAVVAYTQHSAVTAAVASCTAALASTANACAAKAAALASNPATAAAAPPVASGGTAAGAESAKQTPVELMLEVPAPSSEKIGESTAAEAASTAAEASMSLCPLNSPSIVKCKAGRAMTLTTRGVCLMPPALVKIPGVIGDGLYANAFTPNEEATLLTQLQSLFVPEARADLFTPMGIVSSAAISYLLMTSKTLGITIDTFLFSAMNRAIVWGVLAGLAMAASTSTDNVIAKIDANIAKIDAILKEMNSTLGTGTNTAQTTTPNTTKTQIDLKKPTLVTSATNYEDVDLSTNGGGTLPCYTKTVNGKCSSFADELK